MAFISKNSPVANLDVEEAWNKLDDKEKAYAYYLEKASWEGAKMVYFQVAYEGAALYSIFQTIFSAQSVEELKKAATDDGVSVEDLESFIAYIAGFYANYGNYQNFGHSKFIPQCSQDVFEKILKASSGYKNNAELIDRLWSKISVEVFTTEAPYAVIGLPEKGGLSPYYSSNILESDITKVENFVTAKKLSSLNTRLLKTAENQYTLLIASIEEREEVHEYEGATIKLQYGDFKEILIRMNEYLEKAKDNAANENQKQMLEHYIEHFKTGDINAHKDSQRSWIKDVGPVVESNIGFIETYVDPMNIRAYFEGWVAIVNKERSKIYGNLVENAEKIIAFLPWPKEMEKDAFSRPDFTSLDVIGFATNGCPLGINIPNYDDIRENEGFKNVYLGNALGKPKRDNIKYADEADVEILDKFFKPAIDLKVALHELLGHGSGKSLTRDESGNFNFPKETLVNPVTGKPVETWYEPGETWNSKFGKISTSYEECRADTCALHLSLYDEPHQIFGFPLEDKDDIIYAMWLMHLRRGVLATELYNPEAKKWGQAHSQGAYVVMRMMLKEAPGLVTIEDTEDSFVIRVNKEMIKNEGATALKAFLTKLQVFKSTADVKAAEEMYNSYSQVDERFLKLREIVIANKLPRKLELNNHLTENEGSFGLKCFESTFEGIIESFSVRYGNQTADMIDSWEKHADLIRYKAQKQLSEPS